MINPNDITAKYYDIVQRPLKGSEITLEELKLVTKLAPANGKILDVGCGTGRHLKKLSELGYEVNGIDISEGMLNVLKSENTNIKTHSGDFITFDFNNESFDLIILMWNTFNEIALTKDQAEGVFSQLKKILKQDGKILINIDNAETFDPKNLKFGTIYSKNGIDYEQEWKAIDFDEETNTTRSLEKITVKNADGGIIDVKETMITQRWWKINEIEEFCKDFKFKIKNIKSDLNQELYLVLENI